MNEAPSEEVGRQCKPTPYLDASIGFLSALGGWSGQQTLRRTHQDDSDELDPNLNRLFLVIPY
jgi:hypothetical protein